MGDHRYLVHGLVVRSNRDLGTPALDPAVGERHGPRPRPETAPAHDVDVDLDTDAGRELDQADLDAADAAPEDTWVLDRWLAPGRLLVTFPDVGAFIVTRGEITLVEAWDDDPAMLAHLVLDHLMPRVVGLRGDLALHASGVVGPDGTAWLFVGETGTGKSTLATALAAAGRPLLDDDGIRIVDIDGRPFAVPGYAGVRLLPDAGAAVLPDVPPGAPMAAGHEKRRYAVDASSGLVMASSPAPVGLVHVMRRCPGPNTIGPGDVAGNSVDTPAAVTRRRLGFAESITELARHAFHATTDEGDLVREAFDRVARLAGAVRLEELLIPDGLGHLPAVLAALTGNAAEGPPV